MDLSLFPLKTSKLNGAHTKVDPPCKLKVELTLEFWDDSVFSLQYDIPVYNGMTGR